MFWEIDLHFLHKISIYRYSDMFTDVLSVMIIYYWSLSINDSPFPIQLPVKFCSLILESKTGIYLKNIFK